MGIVKRLGERRRGRAYRRFHESCDKLGVPDEVRARVLKSYTYDDALPKVMDWYGGRPV